MSASRILSIRKSDTIDSADIMFPIMFIGEQYGYSLSSIFRKLNNSQEVHVGIYPDIFPHTIQEYFWIKKGVPGKEPWAALGQLNDNTYFLFTAFMIRDTGTFVGNGQMNLWMSVRYSDLVQSPMDPLMYNEYISNTTNR